MTDLILRSYETNGSMFAACDTCGASMDMGALIIVVAGKTYCSHVCAKKGGPDAYRH